MDEENGLELSLGLSFGGSSSKSKSKDGPSESKAEDGSSSKIMNNMNTSYASFKNFFQTNVGSQDHNGKKTVSQLQPSFWTDIGNRPACTLDGSDDAYSSQSNFKRYQQSWTIDNKITDAEEDKSDSKKRKLPSEDINYQKKREKILDHAETMIKVPPGVTLKNSPISINTEDDSSGENEVIAESEAEGSNSWLVSQREDSAKSSSIHRSSDKHVLNDPNAINSQPQNQHFFSGSESNSEQRKVAYGIPLPFQPLTIMSIPYPLPVKVQTSIGASSAAGFTSPCVMQLMPVANGEQAIVQTMSTNNLQVAFGYSPVQLPTLETSSSWVFSSQPHQVSSADGTANSQNLANEPKRSFGRSKHGQTVEWTRKDLLKGLEEFLPIYETRPIKNNMYGMGFDHSFGLWFMSRWLKPDLMIESGAFKGHSTWVLRQAMPETRIISLSPRHPEKYLKKGPAYVDKNCTYFVGKDFVDFGSVNWEHIMKEHGISDLSRVLIFFDDHQNELKRLKQALKAGFRNLIFEDNYDTGTGDHYSLRQICDQSYTRGGGHSCFKDSDEARIRMERKKFWEKSVTIEELCGNGEAWWGVRGYMRDDFNHSNKAISYEEHFQNSRFVESVLDVYWELPPVAGPSLTRQTRYDPARAPDPIIEEGRFGLFQSLGLSRLDAPVFNGYTQMVHVRVSAFSSQEYAEKI